MFFSNQPLFFFGNRVNVYLRGDIQYSLSISLKTPHYNARVFHRQKGQYSNDNIFLSFIVPYKWKTIVSL